VIGDNVSILQGVTLGGTGKADEAAAYDFIDAWLSPETGKALIEMDGYGHSNMKAFQIADPKQVDLIGPGRHRGQHRRAVGEWLDRHAGVAQDLAPERVERANSDGTRLDPERCHGRIEPLGHLDRSTLVEGDRPDGVRRRACGDQPGGTCDEGRGLAAPRRCDAQRRSWRSCGGRPLVRRKASKPFEYRWMENHRAIIRSDARRPVIADANSIHMALTRCYRRSSTLVSRGPIGTRSEPSASEQGDLADRPLPRRWTQRKEAA
jgi:hypothetical protein